MVVTKKVFRIKVKFIYLNGGVPTEECYTYYGRKISVTKVCDMLKKRYGVGEILLLSTEGKDVVLTMDLKTFIDHCEEHECE